MWRGLLLFASSQRPLSLARPAHAMEPYKFSFDSAHDELFNDVNPWNSLTIWYLFASLPLCLFASGS
jgi:hypothetical protein